MLKSKIVRVLGSVVLGFAALLVVPNAARATAPMLDTADNSTIVGNYTFSITIPELPVGNSLVHMEIVDTFGSANKGVGININIFHAGTYTYTINPFGTGAQIQSALPAGSLALAVFGNDANHLVPGINQVEFEYSNELDSTMSRVVLTNMIFKHPCAPGTYSSDGGVPLDGSGCNPAALGRYIPGYGSTSATLCPAGSTALTQGQTSCDPVLAGHFSPAGEGHLAASSCQPGGYQPLSGQAYCLPADLGNYVSDTAAIVETPCAAGTYADETGLDACKPARIGHYVGGAGASIDQQCVAGKYSDTTGLSACLNAPPGTYVAGAGASTKTNCSAGTYQPESGKTSCLSASANYFVSNIGANSQTPCPSGKVSPAGSISAAACVDAPVTPEPVVVVPVVDTTPALPTCSTKKKGLVKKQCLLDATGLTVPKKATLTITVAKAHKKFCSVSGTSVRGLKAGTCTVTVKVKPKKGAASINTTVVTIN